MPFKKGVSGNISGRKSGVSNKATRVQREFIQDLLDNQQTKIEVELKKLTGKQYINAVLGLMEFVIPKLNRTQIASNENKIIKVTRKRCNELI